MTRDELRRQLKTTDWPLYLRLDGKELRVSSPDEMMVPPAGNLVCVFEEGAFEIIGCDHIATLCRVKAKR
jgi:hypothetical protein